MRIRQTLRALSVRPAFTLMAILTLAVGIGANTTMFSVVNGILVKPLPYPEPERLVGVWHNAPGLGIPGLLNCSPGMYFTYRDESRAFENVGLWSSGSTSVTGTGEPEQVRTVWVTYGTLQALGVQPALGRWFSQADDTPGPPENYAILSYGYWQRRFGGDANIIGRMVTVESRPRIIVGVMPRDFRFLNADPEIMVTFRLDRNRAVLGNFSYQGLARLKPGVTVAEANADINRLLGLWIKAWPPAQGATRESFEAWKTTAALRPLKQDMVGNTTTLLWVLMGSVGMVLLVACANVANLVLVRADARQQELGIRRALGAARARIVADLLIENLALTLTGGLLGLALSYAALRLLTKLNPPNLPRLAEISLDARVFAFALAASVGSGVFLGLLTAFKYGEQRLWADLTGGGRTATPGVARSRARNVLVVAQLAFALVLLVSSGLLIRTFQALRKVEPGFTAPEKIQTVRVSIPPFQVQQPERVIQMQKAILEKIQAIPGVTSAAFANSLPMEGFANNDPVFAEDKPSAPGEVPPIRRFKYVSPGLFQTMGTRLVAGRDLTWSDIYMRQPVVLISENLAREWWGEPRAALGKRIQEPSRGPFREIVGVVQDVHDNGVQEAAPTIVYWPVMMENFFRNPLNVTRSVAFAIRSDRAGTSALLNEVRQAVWSVNPNLPLAFVRTQQDNYERSLAGSSFALVMLGIAGTMGLLLAVIGIYAVVSYSVSQRTREIGIRIALGAEARHVQRLFLQHAIVLSALGLSIGLFAAFVLTRLMSSLLFGTSPLDATTYVVVSVLLAVASMVASYVPTRRALGINPLDAFKE